MSLPARLGFIMPIHAYGEDALTLWALSQQLSLILQQLDDSTPPNEALVFYRPSFGRRAGTDGKRRSEFGEFDAIVGTRASVYLIETKWNGSQEIRDGIITIRPEQVRRHEIFRRYLSLWRQHEPTCWDRFIESSRATLEDLFPSLTVPSSKTTLSRNLTFVLGKLTSLGTPIRDVVLFVACGSHIPPRAVSPGNFELITSHKNTVDDFAYFIVDES